ncbi:hypothetical protein DSO57_1026882 [Entomophthora muscae]|uniref:Uncharacterized protein n=1 Tax=Entomophthora muscae TaxID=34485 RepID=A0ACC2SR83_9FUNG|nr:hypothetical protein DSO57_1026882 [Entomophthora muscae]
MIIKEWLFLSEAMVATLFGIAVGPEGFAFVNPLQWDNIDKLTLEFARIVIALQVFAAGVTLPKAYLMKELTSLTILLLPVMFFMWLVSAATIYYILGLSLLESLLISACITPTDPVLANSIVKGRFAEKHVPLHVRNIISAESGANDGLGFPYVFFPLLIIRSASFGEAFEEWMWSIWVYQIFYSIVLGGVIGYVGRKLLFYSQSRELIDKESFLVFGIALSLFIMGLVGLMESDDLLACFIAGNSFTWDDWFRKEIETTHMQEVVDMFFNLSFFIFLGTVLPWKSFSEIGYGQLIALGTLILLFRRVPIVMALKPFTPALHTYGEAFFAGWFGPIGVGAVFYSMVAKMELAKMGPDQATVQHLVFPVSAFMILFSVIVHGMTVPLFKMTSRIDTRTFTNTNAITNLVARLPLLKPGQTVVIERNSDMTTGVIISQSTPPEARPITPLSVHNDLPHSHEHDNLTSPNGRPRSIAVLLTPDGKVMSRHEDYFESFGPSSRCSSRQHLNDPATLHSHNGNTMSRQEEYLDTFGPSSRSSSRQQLNEAAPLLQNRNSSARVYGTEEP